MTRPIPNSVCDDCLNAECVWRAPSWGIDPPVMDCPEKKTPPVTNYASIIRKTPGELAEWIMSIEPAACPFRDDHGDDCRFSHCAQCWLDWMKEEVQNEQT